MYLRIVTNSSSNKMARKKGGMVIYAICRLLKYGRPVYGKLNRDNTVSSLVHVVVVSKLKVDMVKVKSWNFRHC